MNVNLYRTNSLAGLDYAEAQDLVTAEGFEFDDCFQSPRRHTIYQYENRTDGWVWMVTVDDRTGLVLSSYCYEPGARG